MLARSLFRAVRSKHSLQPAAMPLLTTRKSSFESAPVDTIEVALIAAPVVGVTALGAAWLASRYKISAPNQKLVRTGLGIKDILITKTGFQWPFQQAQFIDLKPETITITLHAMSSQKMEFSLPGVFTIGPGTDDDSLEKYCRFVLESESESDPSSDTTRARKLAIGIIEGETRVLAAGMTMDELFNNRAKFKDQVIANVQEELHKFGLQVYNANIKDLEDSVGSEYFQYMRQKTRAGVEGKARIDIAEAHKIANIGEKERETSTRQAVAELDVQAVMVENTNAQARAESVRDLALKTTQFSYDAALAKTIADNELEIKKNEYEKRVEIARAARETETRRATELTKITVDAEAAIERAKGEARAIEIGADAHLYAKQREADGIRAAFQAQADGVQLLMNSVAGDGKTLLQYLMIDRGVFEKLARENANAVRGLNPKITVWSGVGSDQNQPITSLLKTLPPLFETIHDQTGMAPPDWLVKGVGDKPAAVPKSKSEERR